MSADSVALVAIHGTGTPLGDPIEAGALGQALGAGGSRKQPARPLAALSNKACYGHTEGSAGLTGLLLALQVSSLIRVLSDDLCANTRMGEPPKSPARPTTHCSA